MTAPSDFDSDADFRAAVSDLLDELVDQVDALDLDAVDDMDVRLTPGNLQITFEQPGLTGSAAVMVLSQQTPTHELWLSANLTAWHFSRRDGRWVERDSSEPMLDVLGRLLSEKLGGPVALSL